jgi:carbonic anhydrase
MRDERHGLVDNWLRHVQDVQRKHESALAAVANEVERVDRLCELNVVEQVLNLCQTTVVMDAWERRQKLSVHGWIYGLHDGLLRDLGFCAARTGEVLPLYEESIRRLGSGETQRDSRSRLSTLNQPTLN